MVRILVWVLAAVVPAAIGCANREKPGPSATPEPPALASARPAAQCPCGASSAAAPRTTLVPPTPESLDAALGPAPTKPGWIQLFVGKKRYQLDAFDDDRGHPVASDVRGANGVTPGPYAQVKDPNSSKPHFWIGSNASHDLDFSAGGVALRLPGKVDEVGLRIMTVSTGEDWVSTDAVIEVTEFGVEGQVVAGVIYGTMSARLNRDPEPLVGRFRIIRRENRFSP
jgi:hypothetical protein